MKSTFWYSFYLEFKLYFFFQYKLVYDITLIKNNMNITQLRVMRHKKIIIVFDFLFSFVEILKRLANSLQTIKFWCSFSLWITRVRPCIRNSLLESALLGLLEFNVNYFIICKNKKIVESSNIFAWKADALPWQHAWKESWETRCIKSEIFYHNGRH